jgi:glucose-6-phosphate isomerase
MSRWPDGGDAMNDTPLLSLDLSNAEGVSLDAVANDVRRARATLESGTGPGAGMLGWLELPRRQPTAEIARLRAIAERIRALDSLVVVGIGGSYLGAAAVMRALSGPFETGFPVLFAGHHLDADYYARLVAHLGDKRYAVNVISKSGGTTEPSIAFRLLWRDLARRFDAAELRRLVVVTTGASPSGLKRFQEQYGLEMFEVPPDVGGRFSVLSPVGLLPIAAAGHDIDALLDGAREALALLRDPARGDISSNPALAYAAFRLAAYRAGKKIEVLSSSTPRLGLLAEWWKQLYGESEGKGGRGLFPAAMSLTTDLHSLGQWMQDGERVVCETALDVVEGAPLDVPPIAGDIDGLGYLDGMPVHRVDRAALHATLAAHHDGGVPCLRMEIPRIDARTVGFLLYFFEYACGVSAYALGVNPFDQPGVEAYKKNMKALLAK